MSDYATGSGGARTPKGTTMYVDADYAGADANGSFGQPYPTIQAGIDAQALVGAGDVIIAAGAYVEDLALEDGVNLKAAVPGSVTVTGLCTSDDVSLTIEGVHFVDDGVNNEVAFHFTGVAAATVRAILCDFSATALGDHGLLCDNTNAGATMNLEGCTGAADVANANALVSLGSGVLTTRECDLAHASNVAESIELLGTAASTFEARETTLTGTLAAENAAVAPAVTLHDTDIVVGAVSGLTIAAGVTVNYYGGTVDSSDAGQDAVDGAGTLFITRDVELVGSADEYATTLTITSAPFSIVEFGTVAVAGASPQTDSVVFTRVMPSNAYQVWLSPRPTGAGADALMAVPDDAAFATTGFDIVTTEAAGAAIAANVGWLAVHP